MTVARWRVIGVLAMLVLLAGGIAVRLASSGEGTLTGVASCVDPEGGADDAPAPQMPAVPNLASRVGDLIAAEFAIENDSLHARFILSDGVDALEDLALQAGWTLAVVIAVYSDSGIATLTYSLGANAMGLDGVRSENGVSVNDHVAEATVGIEGPLIELSLPVGALDLQGPLTWNASTVISGESGLDFFSGQDLCLGPNRPFPGTPLAERLVPQAGSTSRDDPQPEGTDAPPLREECEGVSGCSFDNGIDFQALREELASALTADGLQAEPNEIDCDGDMTTPPNHVRYGAAFFCFRYPGPEGAGIVSFKVTVTGPGTYTWEYGPDV